MAFEVVPTAAGRLHSDQYTKIIIINTPINLRGNTLTSISAQPFLLSLERSHARSCLRSRF